VPGNLDVVYSFFEGAGQAEYDVQVEHLFFVLTGMVSALRLIVELYDQYWNSRLVEFYDTMCRSSIYFSY